MAEEPLAILWSPAALRDLARFAEFLHEGNPRLAARIAEAVDAAVAILADLPMMGRRIPGGPFRQLAVSVLNASYVLQYRVEGRRVVILRVFHGRERRS